MNIEFRLLFTYSKPLLKLNQTCLFGMREQTCYMFVAEAQTCWEVNLTLSLSPALPSYCCYVCQISQHALVSDIPNEIISNFWKNIPGFFSI